MSHKRKKSIVGIESKEGFTGMQCKDRTEGVLENNAVSLRLREGVVLLLVLVAGYLTLSLYSYEINDPAWSYVGPELAIVNSGGLVGAWIADLLFSLFGFFSWLFPWVIVTKVLRLFRHRYMPWALQPWVMVMDGMGFLLTIFCGAALVSLHYHFIGTQLSAGSGGIVGSLIIEQCLPVFNVTGITLLLMAFFLMGITLVVDFSWFRLMDDIGYICLQSLSYLQRLGLKLSKVCVVICLNWQKQYNSYRTHKKDLLRLKKDHCFMSKSAEMPSLLMPVTTPVFPLENQISVKKEVGQEKKIPFVGIFPEDSRPEVGLLDQAQNKTAGISHEALTLVSNQLELKLKDFGVDIKVVSVHPGPVITRYEIQPAAGVKASRITSLARDLARSLAVISVRVVEVIPNKSVMGVEIPNDNRETVFFSELISSKVFMAASSSLSLALGHDIGGQPVVVDLAKMPHLLVAGTTGSGKSVGVNAMLLSLLFKSGPEQVRLILIDPKMLELSVYDGIPHLLTPVVTDMKEAANALRWCVAEMERRYKLMASMGVRHISGYNLKIKEGIKAGEPVVDPFYHPVSEDDKAPVLERFPFIVVVIDEFADMMMIVGKKVEELIARIAQKARAAGIHLILATQRPSVDVITGLIKANVPTRISFQVSSKIDSRTIIDQGGAEQLLGHGDMLYLPPGTSVPIRVHGAFVGDDEVHRVVADWKRRGEPCYVEEILAGGSDSTSEGSALNGGLWDESEQDALYDEGVAFVTETRRASISFVQRKLKIGYNRAARMIEAMEVAGVISPMASNGNREVLAPPPPKR
ncbi:MAG: DNA translocase FtsK 4TM domain-containing protein [Candidatus Endonucleobacter bathymodioli]|uniref:DNA translocase FtsK n=1 Tax=Candidatus Endonucleibacter bathymodioli TaxID=539814 RepID=A0AA90SM13_9GAMM|nr:DNA translocase FtsK 4TM domain-containing protein [Candidatus Endonucleobacter bathymodioli]